MFVKLAVLAIFLAIACASPAPHGESWSYANSDDWGIADSDSAESDIIPAFSFYDTDDVEENDEEEYNTEDDVMFVDDHLYKTEGEKIFEAKDDKSHKRPDDIKIENSKISEADAINKGKSVPKDKKVEDVVKENTSGDKKEGAKEAKSVVEKKMTGEAPSKENDAVAKKITKEAVIRKSPLSTITGPSSTEKATITRRLSIL